MFIRALITATLACFFASVTPLQAAVTYTLSFEGATLHDYAGDDIGTYSGAFSLTAGSYVTSIMSLATDSCSLSPNAGALYSCDTTQSFNPADFLPDSLLIGFNTHANDLSGSGTGFLFFDPGSFTADGTYSLDTTPPPGYGSFAPTASLTVTSSIPEPGSLTLLACGLLGLGAWRRLA